MPLWSTDLLSLSPASSPSPSLPRLLPISLARWIRIAQSVYYEQINVPYVVDDCLSPWQHMRENFKMHFRLIRVTFAELIYIMYIWNFQGCHICLFSSGMCCLTLSFFPFWLWPYGKRIPRGTTNLAVTCPCLCQPRKCGVEALELRALQACHPLLSDFWKITFPFWLLV